MPLYEYQCRKCDHIFEKLVSISSNEDVQCQKCGSTDVDKLISAGVSMGAGDAGKGECQPRGGFS